MVVQFSSLNYIKMSSLSQVPIISQKDLESIALCRTGLGFALKAFHAPRNTNVSLKLMTNQNSAERDLKVLLQEVARTRRVQSQRLMLSLGVCQFRGLLGIVTEWMHNGSLHSFIHQDELYPDLPFPLCVRILSDVTEGLNHLHSLEVPLLHQCLKPSNVLLDVEYRAKIADYGLTTWRKQQLRSALHSCNKRSCWDLLYLSPEILQGGSFSWDGDIYSFGMMCWEILSRQKPLKGKKTLLEAVTGVCSGVRPGIGPEFIPNSTPHRNKLLQLMLLCWHQEPSYRPQAAECTALLQNILVTFEKKMISNAIYQVIHAKDCAINAAKGPVSPVLEMDVCNMEVIRPQNHSKSSKEITLKTESWSSDQLESQPGSPGREVDQTKLVGVAPHHLALSQRGHSACDSQGSSPPHSLCSVLFDPSTSGEDTLPLCSVSKSWQPPAGPLMQVPAHKAPCGKLQNTCPAHTSTGPCLKKNCCTILAGGRETILSGMTEGRLNRILDVLRSQQVLSRTDYETITSFPTLSSRARALLDTCLGLGENAARTVVAVLSASKFGPLAQCQQTNTVN